MMTSAYSATVSTFLDDYRQGRLLGLMEAGVLREKFAVGPAERKSWYANAQPLARILQSVNPEAVVALEILDPIVRQRVDFAMFGADAGGTHRMEVLELKQWNTASAVPHSKELVVANTHGNTFEEKRHPSLQAHSYIQRFRYWLSVCDPDEAESVKLTAYALLYNMPPDILELLRTGNYSWTQKQAPAIGSADVDVLAASLRRSFAGGFGQTVFQRVCSSPLRPSKRFIEQAAAVIEQRDAFPLIPEQLQAFAKIRKAVAEAHHHGQKKVFVVEGGPGSGKTAIALQAVASALRDNQQPRYVIKSAAMKYSIQKALGEDVQPLISFNDRFGYLPSNSNDLVLVDEAHRIDEIAQMDWSKGTRRQKTKQELEKSLSITQEIIRASKVSVFFIDERQIIQPREANRIDNIKKASDAEKADFAYVRLEAQHRLCGSLEFMNWVDALLGSKSPTPYKLQNCGSFRFKIIDHPEELIQIHDQHESAAPNASRLLTGWCWMWSQKTQNDGSLLDEVVVPGIISRPWEAPKQGKKARLMKGIARGEYWATASSGAQSFGSVYTAQGFDMPTICLLWPCDLIWRNGAWIGNIARKNTKTGAERGGHPHYDNVDPKLAHLNENDIVPYLLNVYRILLTRATKRLYVAFLDKETADFVKSLI